MWHNIIMKSQKKNVTLRLDKNVYDQLVSTASNENRSVANLAETLVLQKLNENNLMGDFEMESILKDKDLLKRIEKGRIQGRALKGTWY